MLNELLDNKLDKKLANLATKQDIGQITGQVSKLAEENELLKREVKKLKVQEMKILKKLPKKCLLKNVSFIG